MNVLLNETFVKNEEKKEMPYVHSNKMPVYCIFRISERKYKAIPAIKGFIKHMRREKETPNADPERFKDNEQLYGAVDLYNDTKEYLKDTKVYANSVIGREILLTASNPFFKGLSKNDFELWKRTNIEWLQNTFKDNLRAVYLHKDETTEHLHCLIVPRLWNEKRQCYTLQNYKYFNGYQMLRDMQDHYAETIQKVFPSISRGIRGSKRKHIDIKKFYSIMDKNSQETDIETLQAKAAHEEMLKMKVNYMDKTLKSFQHFNRQNEEEKTKMLEENQRLLKEIQELKKNISSKDIKEELKQENTQENKKGVSRNFSGKRYNKSV